MSKLFLTVVLLVFSLGAGPAWIEPSARTGEAIEKAIASAYQNPRGRVFIPGGTYRITRTIVISSRGPLLIEGASGASIFPEWNHASSVRLEWHGPRDQPMIQLNAVGVQIKSLMLDGRGIASHGILLINTPSPGTGMNLLEDVTLSNFTVACFQAGRSNAEANCADSFFDRVQFFRAPAGFRSMTQQSVNNQFTGCGFGWLECALDIQQGGAVTVTGQGAAMCDLFLRVRSGGPNKGAINLYSLKIENSGYKRRNMSLVDAMAFSPSGETDVLWGCQVNLHGVWMSQGGVVDAPDDPSPLFLLGPGAQVNIEGGYFRPGGDRDQGLFAVLRGLPNYEPVLKAPNSIWLGKVDSTTFKMMGPGLIEVTPHDLTGTRTQAALRVP